MKRLINRLIRLFRGHKWYIKELADKIDYDGVILIEKCSRCGKIIEV